MGVWIETAISKMSLYCLLSHPVWVCGLKLVIENNTAYSRMSHPVWVCGLKLVHLVYTAKLPRHTLYGCVD